MDEFIKSIQVDDKNYYFLFSELLVSKGRKFFVTTERDGKNIYFEMFAINGSNWKVIGTLPYWIRQIEGRIIEILVHHLEGSN